MENGGGLSNPLDGTSTTTTILRLSNHMGGTSRVTIWSRHSLSTSLTHHNHTCTDPNQHWIKSKTNHKSRIFTPTQRVVGDYSSPETTLDREPTSRRFFLDLVWSNTKINDFYVTELQVWRYELGVCRYELSFSQVYLGMNLRVCKYELFWIFTSAGMEFHTIHLTISDLFTISHVMRHVTSHVTLLKIQTQWGHNIFSKF